MFNLTWKEDGAVAAIELRRPPANAIGDAEIAEFAGLLDRLAENEACRAAVFHAGGRFFSAGADIKFMGDLQHAADGPERLAALAKRMQDTFGMLEELPLPTVCAISGVATGGGFELALACDIRVAERSARVGLPEARLGLLPGAGGTQRVTRIAGAAIAKRLILTGELLNGEQAAAMGLVHEVVADGQGLIRALEFCRSLAASPRKTLAAIKRCIALAPSAQGLKAEIDETLALQREPQTKALINDFLQRSGKK